MVSLSALWFPVLLSAVLVFAASSIIHMVLRYHKNEYKKLPGEENILEAMRKEGKRLGEEVVRELVLCYGSDYPAVLQYVEKDPKAGRPVAGDRPTIRAMIQHAVLHEMALRLADVIFRRTGLGTIGDPGEDCLRTCASIMGEELGWSATRVEEELEVARTPFRTRSESPA